MVALAWASAPFDVVIDDGSHYVRHQLESFRVLFPAMSSHGMYVVEDTGGASGDPELVTVSILATLIKNIMYWPHGLDATQWPTLSTFGDEAGWIDKHVTGIAFYRWIVFVTRGRNPEDNPYLPVTDPEIGGLPPWKDVPNSQSTAPEG